MTMAHEDMPDFHGKPSKPGAGGSSSPGRTAQGRLAAFLQNYGLFAALVAAIALFSALRPEAFFSTANARAVLTLAAPLMIASLGLTIALAVNEIDLSVGSMIGLGGTLAVCLMSFYGVPWLLAIAAALLLAVAAGLIIGALVSIGGANSLIITLGMATFLTGIEFSLTDQRTIYTNLDPAYVAIGQSYFLGMNLQVWIAGAIAACAWILLERTETGRFIYAVGANPNAAYLAGVPVNRLRIFGFACVSVCAAVSGILLTSQSASAFSNAGQPYLLPAFASAFLGSTMSAEGRFTVFGTALYRGDSDGADNAAAFQWRHQSGPGRAADRGRHAQPAWQIQGRDLMALLSLSGISKAYPGVVAAENVDLSVAKGEIVGLVGKNGAGKSTLIRIIAGAERPDAGSILIDGQPMRFANASEASAAGIAVVHQELGDIPLLTVGENILLGLTYPGKWGLISRRRLRARAQEALDAMRMTLGAEQPVSSLSVAERRIVMIARGIAAKAKVVVLDEPTASLTETEIADLFAVIRRMQAAGVAIVYVSHRLRKCCS